MLKVCSDTCRLLQLSLSQALCFSSEAKSLSINSECRGGDKGTRLSKWHFHVKSLVIIRGQGEGGQSSPSWVTTPRIKLYPLQFRARVVKTQYSQQCHIQDRDFIPWMSRRRGPHFLATLTQNFASAIGSWGRMKNPVLAWRQPDD